MKTRITKNTNLTPEEQEQAFDMLDNMVGISAGAEQSRQRLQKAQMTTGAIPRPEDAPIPIGPADYDRLPATGGPQGSDPSIGQLAKANNSLAAVAPNLTEAIQGGLNVNINGEQRPIEVILNGGGLQNILNQESLNQIADAVSAKLKGNGPRPDGRSPSPELTT